MSSKRVNFVTKRIVTPKPFHVTWLWLIPSRMTSKLCNLSFVTSVTTNLSMLTCWISIKLLVVVKRGVFRARNVTLFGILLCLSGKNCSSSIEFLSQRIQLKTRWKYNGLDDRFTIKQMIILIIIEFGSNCSRALARWLHVAQLGQTDQLKNLLDN